MDQVAANFGCFAIFVGTFLEGETILALGGVAAAYGSCGISPWRLAFFNFIGTLLWAPLVAGIGYLAGQALDLWVGRLRHVQIALLMAIVLIAMICWLVILWRRKRQ